MQKHPLGNSYFESKATKNISANNLSPPSSVFENRSQGRAPFCLTLFRGSALFKFCHPPRWVVRDDRHVPCLPLRGIISHAHSEIIAHPPRWAPAFSLALNFTFLTFASHSYLHTLPCAGLVTLTARLTNTLALSMSLLLMPRVLRLSLGITFDTRGFFFAALWYHPLSDSLSVGLFP